MNLPDHLPAEAALALYDLISDLQAAIWEKYEHHLFPLIVNQTPQVQAHEADEQLPDAQEDFDDLMPF